MFCSKCGKESVNTATFCIACGSRLSPQKATLNEAITGFPQSGWQLAKMNVVLLIFLTGITCGIYCPFWFLKRRNAINSLHSSEKLSSEVFVFTIVVGMIAWLVKFITWFMQGIGERITATILLLNGLTWALWLISGIILLVQGFKVRRIFNDHFNAHFKKGMSLSGAATFFFGIYYLQHKINNSKKEGSESRPVINPGEYAKETFEENKNVSKKANESFESEKGVIYPSLTKTSESELSAEEENIFKKANEDYREKTSEPLKVQPGLFDAKTKPSALNPATKSLKRFKPISATPNLLFIVYLLVAFPLYHLVYLTQFTQDYFMIGQIYGNLRTFICFFGEFFGFSIPPLILIIIYNSKIGGGKIKIASIIVTISFILLATVGTLTKISLRGSYSKLNTHENKEKEIVNPPVSLQFPLSEEKRQESQDKAASSSATSSTPIWNSPMAEIWFEKGNAFSVAGRNQEAIEAYTKAIELDPKDATAYNNRGVVYESLRDHQQAIRDYDKAIELDPKFAKAYYNRGIVYSHLGDHQQAIRDCSKAIELNPKYATAYNNRGSDYNELGQYQQAIRDCNMAIELDPKLAQPYHNRGRAYCALGDYQQAIRDFDRAIELNPQLAEAYVRRGSAYLFLRDYRQVVPDCNRAIELNPNDGRAYFARGAAYLGLGDLTQGFESLRIAARLGLKEAQDLCRSHGISW